jgi:hypothetical protein
MDKQNDPPVQQYEIGQEVMTLDAGPGIVEELTPPRPAGITYNGTQFTPWLYHVRRRQDGTVHPYSFMMILPSPPPPRTPPPPTQVALYRTNLIADYLVASTVAFALAARGKTDGESFASINDKANYLLGQLPPQDLAIVQGLIRAQETVLAHIESLRKDSCPVAR